MKTDYADALVCRGMKLKENRSAYDHKCAEIADVMRPVRAEFRGVMSADARRTAKLFDGTAMMAGQNLAGGLYGMMTNPANTWCGYATMDPELNRSYRAKRWLETVSARGLASVGPSFSQFYAQKMEQFLDLVFFGQGVMSSEVKDDLSGFIDMCRPISECFHDVDDDGQVNTMFRIWRTTAGRVINRFGKENCSTKLQDKAKKQPDAEVELMHATVPKSDYIAEQIGKGGHPFRSCYMEVDTKEVIREKGYYSFPYTVPRWSAGAGEINGRGPGELALGDTNTLQTAVRSNLNRGALMGAPPLMAPNRGVIQEIRFKPNGINFGAMTMQGKPLLQPMDFSGGLPYDREQIAQLRDQCKDYFFFSFMQLVGRTGMTATEIVERQEERLRLVAPYVGRINTEDLAPFMLRRFDMFTRIPGILPEPPPELQGHKLQVEFLSPMAMVQKSQAATAVIRAWGFVEQMAQVQPEVLDGWDGDAAGRIVSEGVGAPISVWRDPDEVAARRAQRQQQLAQQAQLAAAQQGADAAQKGAQAMAAMRGGAQ